MTAALLFEALTATLSDLAVGLLAEAIQISLLDLIAGVGFSLVIGTIALIARGIPTGKQKAPEVEPEPEVEPAFQFKLEHRPAPVAETDFAGKARVDLECQKAETVCSERRRAA